MIKSKTTKNSKLFENKIKDNHNWSRQDKLILNKNINLKKNS